MRPVVAALALALAGPAGAATIQVDGTTCSLADALNAANADKASAGCSAGQGPDTLLLTSPVYTLHAIDNSELGANGLPVIVSAIRIDGDPDRDGHNAVIGRSSTGGTPDFRILAVGREGRLMLDHVTVANGISDSGGGIYNLGTLELSHSIVTGNQGSGVVNRGGSVDLRDSRVIRNRGSNGGGLDNQAGTMSLSDSLVSGNEAVYGGGLRNASGRLTVRHTRIAGNRASYDGGGVYNFNGRLRVSDSTLTGNAARYYGGALLNFGDARLSRTNLSENRAYAGGALANDDGGKLSLIHSAVSGNTADEFGGGLVNGRRFYGEQGGTVAVAGSTFEANSAGYGGGAMLNWDGPLSLIGSTLSGNHAGWVGGAIYNSSFRYDGRLTIEDSTVTGNHADGNGGALYQYFTGRLTVSNSIFANSKGPGSECYMTESAVLEFRGVNLIEDGSCGVAEQGGLTGDPRLGPLADNGGPTRTQALLPGSPALDAADDALCGKRDQRGVPRPQGPHCDIGAFEHITRPAPAIAPLIEELESAPTGNPSGGGGGVGPSQATAIHHQLLVAGVHSESGQFSAACAQFGTTAELLARSAITDAGDIRGERLAVDLQDEIASLSRSMGCRR